MLSDFLLPFGILAFAALYAFVGSNQLSSVPLSLSFDILNLFLVSRTVSIASRQPGLDEVWLVRILRRCALFPPSRFSPYPPFLFLYAEGQPEILSR
jgi:hypothetical protein